MSLKPYQRACLITAGHLHNGIDQECNHDLRTDEMRKSKATTGFFFFFLQPRSVTCLGKVTECKECMNDSNYS